MVDKILFALTKRSAMQAELSSSGDNILNVSH